MQQCHHDTSSTIFKENTVKFLEQSLYRYPYPTCQLLQFFPTISSDISYKILSHLIRNLDDDDTEKGKVYNLLSNVQWPDKLVARFRKEILPIVCNLLRQTTLNRQRLWLCLMAATEPHQLQHQSLRQLIAGYWLDGVGGGTTDLSASLIFIQAAINRKHFLDSIRTKQWTNDSIPKLCHETLFLARTIATFDKPRSYMKVVARLNEYRSSMEAYPNTCWNHLLHIELCRLLTIQCQLVRMGSSVADMNVDQIMSTYNVIDYLCEHHSIGSDETAAIVRQIIDINHRYTADLKIVHPSMDTVTDGKCNEMDLCDQFCVIKLLLDVIQLDQLSDNYDTVLAMKIGEVKKILQRIDALSAYVRLLEMAFSLVFLRWEHIRGGGGTAPTTATTMYDDVDFVLDSTSEYASAAAASNSVRHQRGDHKRYEKYGFVCRPDIVDCLLKTLNYSATQKKHSEVMAMASDSVRAAFNRIHEHIIDASWRFSLFRVTNTGGHRAATNRSQYFSTMIVPHNGCGANGSGSSSSDDEREPATKSSGRRNRRSCVSLLRRKPPSRRSRKSDGETKSKSFSTENEQKSGGGTVDMTMSRCMSFGEKRCIVSKMLGSVEHLMTTCMGKGDTKNLSKLMLMVSWIFYFLFFVLVC